MSKLSINMRRMIVKYTDICWLITNWKANRKTRKRCKLNNKCYFEAERRIQYREFEGKLCVALDNIPLIPLDGTENEGNTFLTASIVATNKSLLLNSLVKAAQQDEFAETLILAAAAKIRALKRIEEDEKLPKELKDILKTLMENL